MFACLDFSISHFVFAVVNKSLAVEHSFFCGELLRVYLAYLILHFGQLLPLEAHCRLE